MHVTFQKVGKLGNNVMTVNNLNRYVFMCTDCRRNIIFPFKQVVQLVTGHTSLAAHMLLPTVCLSIYVFYHMSLVY